MKGLDKVVWGRGRGGLCFEFYTFLQWIRYDSGVSCTCWNNIPETFWNIYCCFFQKVWLNLSTKIWYPKNSYIVHLQSCTNINFLVSSNQNYIWGPHPFFNVTINCRERHFEIKLVLILSQFLSRIVRKLEEKLKRACLNLRLVFLRNSFCMSCLTSTFIVLCK